MVWCEVVWCGVENAMRSLFPVWLANAAAIPELQLCESFVTFTNAAVVLHFRRVRALPYNRVQKKGEKKKKL